MDFDKKILEMLSAICSLFLFFELQSQRMEDEIGYCFGSMLILGPVGCCRIFYYCALISAGCWVLGAGQLHHMCSELLWRVSGGCGSRYRSVECSTENILLVQYLLYY